MAKDYTRLSGELLKSFGGKDNIKKLIHCTTRLRFSLYDKEKVQVEVIKKVEGIMGVQWSGDELQVIIGPAVAAAYAAVCQAAGINGDTGNIGDEKGNQISRGIKGWASAIIKGISASLAPAIQIFVGVGLIKVIVLLGELAGILTPEMPTDMMLTFVGDAGLYFLPVFIGGFAAKRFGGNIGLGMLTGAMLIAPGFINGVASGTGVCHPHFAIFSLIKHSRKFHDLSPFPSSELPYLVIPLITTRLPLTNPFHFITFIST